jgi:hypothetical protein
MNQAPAAALAVALWAGLAAAPVAAQNPRPANQADLLRELRRGPAADQPRPPLPQRKPYPPDLAPSARPSDENAEEARQRLQQVLRQYPPSLREVLRLDPSLLTNPGYLEPYPSLAEFLGEHPEVAHNPAFFLPDYGEYRDNRTDPKLAALRTLEDTLAGLAVLTGFLTFVGTIAWLLQRVIEHRRWLRVSKTHTDTHTKLLDRLTSNEDLMAYMQSPAGRRFLEAAPLPLGAGPRALAAPVGRILWSVQAGCIVAFGGAGLMYASGRFATNSTFAEIHLPLFLMGATAVAIGAGFVVSAVIAYGLSRRLGLLATSASGPVHEPDAEPGRLS